MMRSLVVAFGVVTALAVAGTMTPKGQAMLGLNHPAAAQTAPVTIIEDKPAPVPAPVQSIAPKPAAPVTGAPAAHAAPVAMPRPQARPVGPVSQRPPAGQSVPQQGGPGGLAGVANILLNLPQILDQAHVGPARGPDSGSGSGSSDSKPVQFHKKSHGDDSHGRDAGDGNN